MSYYYYNCHRYYYYYQFSSNHEMGEVLAVSWATGPTMLSSSLSAQLPKPSIGYWWGQSPSPGEAAPSPPDTRKAVPGTLTLATFCFWEQNQMPSLHPDNAAARNRQRPALNRAISVCQGDGFSRLYAISIPSTRCACWVTSRSWKDRLKDTRPLCKVSKGSRWRNKCPKVQDKCLWI